MLFLIQFAQKHCDFRVPELESVAKALEIEFEYVSKYDPDSPFLIIQILAKPLVSPLFNSEMQDGSKLESNAIISTNFVGNDFFYSKARRLAKRCILIKTISELVLSTKESASNLPQLLKNCANYQSFAEKIFGKTYKFQYISHGTHPDPNFLLSDQIALFNQFQFLPTAEVVLDDSKVQVKFIIFEDFSSTGLLKSSYFCIYAATGARNLIEKYNVKKRPYIGTTSMDSELSLIMANMGCIRKGLTLGNDPFVGTGSLLLAMSAMGAYSMGCEIDPRQLRGGASFDKSKRPIWDRALGKHVTKASCDWWTNVVYYGLEGRVLDVVVADVSQDTFVNRCIFDCIVTDPPYGIRAGAKKSANEEEGFHFDCVIGELLNYAGRVLTVGGRIVFWFPVIVAENALNPVHPSFKILYCSEQNCGKWARRLITMEKCADYEELTVSSGDSKNFRDKIFKAHSS